jgi:PAS domain S-box-containing protein
MRRQILLLGLVLAVSYWVIETVADFILGEGSVSTRLLPADPNEIWMRLVIVSLILGLTGYVAVAGRRVEEERLRNEERFELLVQNSSDIISVLDAEGTIVYQSPSIERVLGHKPEKRVGKSVFEDPLVHPDDLQKRRDLLSHALRSPRSEVRGEFRMRHADGSWRHIEAVARNLLEDPNLRGIVMNYRDITERKRRESVLSEIRAAERRQLARDLHDGVLQELLDALYSMQAIRLTSMGEEGRVLPELDEQIDDLRKATEGLRGVINNLRRGRVQEQPFLHLLKSVVAANRQKAPEIEIDLYVDAPFASEPSEKSKISLLRILQEALINVRRHSAARHVRVNLWAEGQDIIVEVSDDGRGFEPEIDPEATWGKVGLASMREHALELGGDLHIESTAGEGTRVMARVPVVASAAKADALHSPSNPGSNR